MDGVSVASIYSALKTLTKRGHLQEIGNPMGIRENGRRTRLPRTAAGSTAPVRSGRGSPFNNAVTTRIADFTPAEVADQVHPAVKRRRASP